MTESQMVGRLAYLTHCIGLIFILIGLLDGFGLVYLIMSTGKAPAVLVSAHSHFLCMSIIILVIGLAMRNWERDLEEKRVTLKPIQLKSARASVVLLALGAILAFIFFSAGMPPGGLIGDTLYFIGFLMVSIGWILGAKQTKPKATK